MRRRKFGPTGVEVPVLGLGTWMLEEDDRGRAVEALRRGVELGMAHVDTAEMYGGGAVEELLGETFARGELERDRLFLASKVLPENATREGTVAACERSLRRLRTDALDLYMLHWPGSVPLEESVEGLLACAERGLARAIGLSNCDEDELERAVRVAGEGVIACDQVLYHLEERAIEHSVLPACRELGIALVGYSPFGQGRFPDPDSAGGRVLDEIARGRGATPLQVALAFLVRHEGTFAIPKSGDPSHVEENAGAGELALDDQELRRLDEAFPAGAPRGLPWV